MALAQLNVQGPVSTIVHELNAKRLCPYVSVCHCQGVVSLQRFLRIFNLVFGLVHGQSIKILSEHMTLLLTLESRNVRQGRHLETGKLEKTCIFMLLFKYWHPRWLYHMVIPPKEVHGVLLQYFLQSHASVVGRGQAARSDMIYSSVSRW